MGFDNEIARSRMTLGYDDAYKQMKIIKRYLRILTQHKFISMKEAYDAYRIPYNGVVAFRLLNRIAGIEYEDFSLFQFKMFSRLLRHIILILLNFYEDWSIRKDIYCEFMKISKINKKRYQEAFNGCDIMNGWDLLHHLFDDKDRAVIESKLHENEILEKVYYTYFDVRMSHLQEQTSEK